MEKHSLLRGPYFLRRELANRCAELLEMTTSREADLRDVARYAAEHAVLADALMRMANSVGAGACHRVRDVNHAVALLGRNRIRDFASRNTSRRSRTTAASAATPRSPVE